MPLIALTSFYSTQEAATQAAQHVLNQRLVACCNILPGITSLYWWEGALTESSETQLSCKTTPALADAAMEALRATHPYQCPAILRHPIEATADYTQWVAEVTAEAPSPPKITPPRFHD